MFRRENHPSRVDSVVPCDRSFHLIHLILDLAAVALAWRAALEVRLALNCCLPVEITRSVMELVALRFIYVLLLWIAVSLVLRTYQGRHNFSRVRALFHVAKSAVVVSTLTVTVTFFSRQLGAELSRSFVLIFSPICFLLLNASLSLSECTAKRIQLPWKAARRVAVLGFGPDAEDMIETIRQGSGGSVSVRGLIMPEGVRMMEAASSGTGSGGVCTLAEVSTVPLLGTVSQLAELINRECLDGIIIADDSLSEDMEEQLWQVASRMRVTVSRPLRAASPDVLIKYEPQYGMHLIHISAAPFRQWREVVKRALDVITSLALITILLPAFVLLAVLIRVTSKGPVIYCSRRVGKGGRYFTFWKFRSMYVDGPRRCDLGKWNEKSGHIFKIRRDPRVTPVGRVVRRLSLDELPQLFNVLAGDMSLVGPRPLPAEDLDPDGMSRKFAEWANQRSNMRPGVTGLWQVRGRSDLPFAKMIELDLQYIREWSIAMDLGILLQTPGAIIRGVGAY
jgi:exopolysaccharide biosynthesis polyprenyl glycosylphosphotransferase